jgi:hypothetical protein
MKVLRASCIALAALSTATLSLADDRKDEADARDEVPAATPYRPSVATPAALSAPGWIELEAGGLQVRDSGSARRTSWPYTVKLAFTEDWGVRIGGEAWVRRVDENGEARSGGGDTAVVVKRRFAVDERSAFGLEGGVLVPTARSGVSLGSGGTDLLLNGIYSTDLPAEMHTDLNLVAIRLGHPDPGASRTQWLWAAALSKALNERWGLTGELAGTQQGGATSSAQFLGAVTFNVSRALVLDAGLAHGIGASSNTRWAFAGLTWLAARLF